MVNFEHISHLCSSVSIVNFKQVNASWVSEFPSVVLLSISAMLYWERFLIIAEAATRGVLCKKVFLEI